MALLPTAATLLAEPQPHALVDGSCWYKSPEDAVTVAAAVAAAAIAGDVIKGR
jgi:hypothetical protein